MLIFATEFNRPIAQSFQRCSARKIEKLACEWNGRLSRHECNFRSTPSDRHTSIRFDCDSFNGYSLRTNRPERPNGGPVGSVGRPNRSGQLIVSAFSLGLRRVCHELAGVQTALMLLACTKPRQFCITQALVRRFQCFGLGDVCTTFGDRRTLPVWPLNLNHSASQYSSNRAIGLRTNRLSPSCLPIQNNEDRIEPKSSIAEDN